MWAWIRLGLRPLWGMRLDFRGHMGAVCASALSGLLRMLHWFLRYPSPHTRWAVQQRVCAKGRYTATFISQDGHRTGVHLEWGSRPIRYGLQQALLAYV